MAANWGEGKKARHSSLWPQAVNIIRHSMGGREAVTSSATICCQVGSLGLTYNTKYDVNTINSVGDIRLNQ